MSKSTSSAPVLDDLRRDIALSLYECELHELLGEIADGLSSAVLADAYLAVTLPVGHWRCLQALFDVLLGEIGSADQ
ncbi:hypothetical protein [Phenylobacterium soli]|uniref:Uncharacterized protein n=1 Tax=Phenylobacterium soli TaxID=2170551 RepID=A0A328AAJ2_9CAUL|nr:hypothetical protein [Phenylobacterium soli]RAK51630.1 hypothetical protein DJ017_17495 [Phenylobacterium soli]